MASGSGHDFDQVESVAKYLLDNTTVRPEVGVICGSGLAGLAASVENQHVFNYEDIPGFPAVTVHGHVGKLVFGTIKGKTVVCLQGRFHFYEGHSIHKITFPVRVLAALGIKTLIVTNAAGGINSSFAVGDIMIIKDHIGMPVMAGSNPLVGRNDDRFGPRFPSMTKAYNRSLQNLALSVSAELGYGDFTKSGVYCMVSGPSYETPAELRLIQTIGADAVGMSTVPEVIVAAHSGVAVLGISLITNKCVMSYETNEEPNHLEVLEVGKMRAACVQSIVENFIGRL